MMEMITIQSALGAMCFGGNIVSYPREMNIQHVYEELGKITFQLSTREQRYPFKKGFLPNGLYITYHTYYT